ncbi:hypothetical protein [Niabella beijingensis]|uniref:hypothetical protein n=1 Tax=Niabella beijingensis TaxID=2872700 RepID=UPI001CBBE59C|nr:hypothetical protein [Niabella beijingensis]MBZ4192576.1 hypothetical protein [Niabella beijingensis]
MDLSGLIIQKIKDTGAISFRDYMELCLYHPLLGYYTAEEHPTAPQEDFYTCATLTPAFGIIIARQLEEICGFTLQSGFLLSQTVLMGMGSRMKVLIQEKGGGFKKLSGLKMDPSPEGIPAATVLKESVKPI